MLEMRIFCRVPLLVIDSVQHPEKHTLSFAQNVVQLAAVFRCRDLTCITGTYRSDDVREIDRRLQAIDRAVKLHTEQIEIIQRQVAKRERRSRENALISKVVDSETDPRQCP